MNLEVTFRNLRAREEVRRRAMALFKKLHRFLDPAADGQVIIRTEHGSVIVEGVITSEGETHKVTEEAPEIRAALDRMFHTMETSLRRGKERRRDKRARGADSEVDGFGGEPLDADAEEDDLEVAIP